MPIAMSVRKRPRIPALAVALLPAACGDSSRAPVALEAPASPPRTANQEPDPDRPAGLPESANWELHRQLLDSRAADYSPADGGGVFELVEASPVHCSERGVFTLRYTTGPLGVAVGGKLYFQVDPWWGWSDPQVEHSAAAGFTVVETSSAQARLHAEALGNQSLLLTVQGGNLAPDETVTIRYGEGNTAVADRYAEQAEVFFLWVDGDGDGSRKLVSTGGHVDIMARPPAELLLTLPSTASVDEEIGLHLAFLDARANATADFVGSVVLKAADGLEIPAQVEFEADHRGRRRIVIRAKETGIFSIEAKLEEALFHSNPILIRKHPRRMLWADLQGHSALSDGSASPEQYYSYARDVAGLDVVSLTDHDHHGLRPLDENPGIWKHIQAVNRRFHEPGRFVALLGFEWTSWLWGHRHVIYFTDTGPLLSNVDPATDTPQELWEALAGYDALTIAHHPAGAAQATDWSIAPPPDLEPLVEIVSVHGSSEARTTPRPIYRARDGHFVRDALERGYRLGFLGSTDGHDGHPGLAHRNAPSGGLAAILTGERTRTAVAAALRRRACYATSGVRIYLEFSLGAHPMGSVAPPPDAQTTHAYVAFVVGAAPLEYVELIKNGVLLYRLEVEDEQLQAGFAFEDPERASGDYAYLRVTQQDGHAAWSSPIWTE